MSVTTVRRVRSVSTAELRLFGRNRTALFSALAMPLVLAGAISGTDLSDGPLSANAFLITSLLGFVLLAAVYYNLVTTFVARREDLVLKRLRAGELTDGEILTGIASPMIVVAVGQILLFVLAGAVLLGLPAPVNIPVLLLGALGGVAVFVLLAAVSAGFTKTTETAQITTLPVLLACMIGSGLLVPLDGLPATLTSVLRMLPLSPVIDLMRLGWLGSAGADAPADFTGVLAAAPLPAAILGAWMVFGAVTVRRRFRWEPRD
jgi:ABC-2 type transport system permease protein